MRARRVLRAGRPDDYAAKLASLTFISKLPDSFKDFVAHYTSKKINPDLLTHCNREFAHAQWQLLLDEEFLHAYQHGIVVQWEDGVTRRFYPRILSYSADYPEK